MVCQSWALQGYGTPTPIYVVYILKIVFYVWVWSLFCSFTPGLGELGSFGSWYYEPVAFQKAVLWSMAFEGLGLGCGSGPLTGRYNPPFGGALYFCRPGTIKMPLFPGLPIFGGPKRTVLDVALYVAHIAFLFRALIAPELSVDLFIPTLVLLPLLGLTDKTIFLASRAEHYYTALVCFMFAGDWLAGSKLVWVAIWMWAATSKLNHHFPSVVAVMQSNSPLTRFGPIRKLLYRSYPTTCALPGSHTSWPTRAPRWSTHSRLCSSSATEERARRSRSRSCSSFTPSSRAASQWAFPSNGTSSWSTAASCSSGTTRTSARSASARRCSSHTSHSLSSLCRSLATSSLARLVPVLHAVLRRELGLQHLALQRR